MFNAVEKHLAFESYFCLCFVWQRYQDSTALTAPDEAIYR